jgi:hypothetical protein
MRRTNAELFLDKLRKKSNGEQKLIGNKALLEALGWDAEKYGRIKAQLLDADKIIGGRGKGGSVAIADAPDSTTTALDLFISYSHADEDLKNKLVKHLEPLKRLNLIAEWHDRQIKAGEDWGKTISDRLEKAKIILLLVSIDFINSKYCYDIELEKALELHYQKKALVIPIVLRFCMWQHTSFAKIQALPKDAKAICSWPDQDEAMTSVAEGVKLAAETIRASQEI